MGASSWSYVAPYDLDVATSLRHMQERLLREGRFYWYWDAGYPDVEVRSRPSTVTELWNSEDFWDCGTGTVLDIMRAVDTADAPRWTITPMISPQSGRWRRSGSGTTSALVIRPAPSSRP
jgi:hypothetical protein